MLDESKDAPERMVVYHGSGAKFDRFDHSFMGTGEGAQAFGWGTYVTEVEGIGKQYAEAGNPAFSSLRAKIGNIDAALHSLDLDVERANRELEQNSNESAKERAKYIIENAKYRREALYKERASVEKEMSKLGRNLYTVEIPDDNGSNYLHWEDVVPKKVETAVKERLFERLSEGQGEAYKSDLKQELDDVFKYSDFDGKGLYNNISAYLGGDKQASLFLRDMGFVGINYPAEAMTGGRADKAKNYVIFNESDARITGHVEFFRTANGTVYGWAVNGKVYLTSDGINPNTPVHEYTHLWASVMEKNNPEGWAKIAEGLKASPVWNEVLADEGYRDIWNNDNRVASEVLSRLAGRENYRREMERAQREIDNATNPIEAAERITFRESVKQAVQRFWDNVKRLFQKITGKAGEGSWEDFVEMPLRDFWAGVKPEATGSPLDRKFIGEQGAANDLATAEEGDVLYRTKETAPETVSVQNEHLQTVVSSADGAKVLKDLDNAIVEYENDTKTKEKTFLGNLAKVLGAKKHGSNSQYATFEAVNGKVFTIRLANHNATVSTFDNHDENEGISIVVTAQGNNGITNDGNAHIVEFFYDAIKLRKADGKPLVEILKSIKQALYSGEYRDTTGLAIREEVNSDILSREGYGPASDSEVATESDVYAKALGRPRYTGRKMREYVAGQRQKMVERANELAEKLHLDNVEVVTEEGKTTAKGFYTKSTGKIAIVIPNHSSVADVEQTLLHEAVAHYGLRQLFGESFNTFLDNVYYNASEEIRAEIDRLAMEKYDGETRTATEEYLASLAENTNFENAERSSWWQKIKRFFVDMLAKAGVKLDAPLTDNELRYILWRSYENLAEPGRYRSIIGEAADIAKQYDLGVGNYAPVQANNNMVAERDVLNREGTPATEEFINATMVASNWGNTHKGAAPCIVIQSADTLRAQLEQAGVAEEDIQDLLSEYEKEPSKRAGAMFVPDSDIVVVIDSTLEGGNLKSVLWHEATHRAIRLFFGEDGNAVQQLYDSMPAEKRKEWEAQFKKKGYKPEEYAEEALCYFVENLYLHNFINDRNSDAISKLTDSNSADFVKCVKFVQPLIDFITNGQKGETNRSGTPRGGILGRDGQKDTGVHLRNAGNESGDTRKGIKARRGTGDPVIHERALAQRKYEERANELAEKLHLFLP